MPPPPRKRMQRLAGRRKGGNPVMNHAPDVAEQHVIVARERLKSFDEIGLDISA